MSASEMTKVYHRKPKVQTRGTATESAGPRKEKVPYATLCKRFEKLGRLLRESVMKSGEFQQQTWPHSHPRAPLSSLQHRERSIVRQLIREGFVVGSRIGVEPQKQKSDDRDREGCSARKRAGENDTYHHDGVEPSRRKVANRNGKDVHEAQGNEKQRASSLSSMGSELTSGEVAVDIAEVLGPRNGVLVKELLENVGDVAAREQSIGPAHARFSTAAAGAGNTAEMRIYARYEELLAQFHALQQKMELRRRGKGTRNLRRRSELKDNNEAALRVTERARTQDEEEDIVAEQRSRTTFCVKGADGEPLALAEGFKNRGTTLRESRRRIVQKSKTPTTELKNRNGQTGPQRENLPSSILSSAVDEVPILAPPLTVPEGNGAADKLVHKDVSCARGYEELEKQWRSRRGLRNLEMQQCDQSAAENEEDALWKDARTVNGKRARTNDVEICKVARSDDDYERLLSIATLQVSTTEEVLASSEVVCRRNKRSEYQIQKTVAQLGEKDETKTGRMEEFQEANTKHGGWLKAGKHFEDEHEGAKEAIEMEAAGEDSEDQRKIPKSHRLNAIISMSTIPAATTALDEDVAPDQKIFNEMAREEEGGSEARVVEMTEVLISSRTSSETAEARVKEALRTFSVLYMRALVGKDADPGAAAPTKTRKKPKRVFCMKPKHSLLRQNQTARPDLKALKTMMSIGNLPNAAAQLIGSIPGIPVNYRFTSRAEMVVAGMHRNWMRGVDYISHLSRTTEIRQNDRCGSTYELPIAVCVVVSEQYASLAAGLSDIIYAGEGGHGPRGAKRQAKDQALTHGNLGLWNSMSCKNPVRVVRKYARKLNSSNTYLYAGLYQVSGCENFMSPSGFGVYRFTLSRLGGQSPLKRM